MSNAYAIGAVTATLQSILQTRVPQLAELADAQVTVQPLDKAGQPKGETIVAADATRMAGPGEFVYYEGGREAAVALDPWFVPIDHTIIGIVDELHSPP